MFASRESILSLLNKVRTGFRHPGDLFLVGESSLVLEDLGDFCNEVILSCRVAETDYAELCDVIDRAAQDESLTVFIEHPADVIPLPTGASKRARPVTGLEDVSEFPLRIRHFDPYSVAIRFIARGDEPDYDLALSLLDAGWIEMREFQLKIEDLLPRFSYDTIQQDPAEFRRKIKGLFQMYKSNVLERT